MKLPAATLLLFVATLGDPPVIPFGVLSNFDYKEGMELPKSVTKYNEKEIRISGFMATEDGSTEGEFEYFILIDDACGCEGTPKLNEMIFCAMPEGQKTKLHPGSVEVTGTLYIQEEKEEGVVVSLYTMSVTSVKK